MSWQAPAIYVFANDRYLIRVRGARARETDEGHLVLTVGEDPDESGAFDGEQITAWSKNPIEIIERPPAPEAESTENTSEST